MTTTEKLAPSTVKRRFNKWVENYCKAHSTADPSPMAYGRRVTTVSDSEILIDANLAIPDLIDAMIDNYLRDCVATARWNTGFDRTPIVMPVDLEANTTA